jgi:hypothetical protein
MLVGSVPQQLPELPEQPQELDDFGSLIFALTALA